MNKITSEWKHLTERFVEALSLETQTGEVQWYFEKGHGTAAHCLCEGRELIVIPDHSEPDRDGYALYSTEPDGRGACLLMGRESGSEPPDCLCSLYQDITESIAERSAAPAVLQMQAFVRKAAERQCLYSILDAAKLLSQTISNHLQDID